MDLYYIIRLIKRKIIYLIVIPLLMGILAFILTLNQKPQFKSTARLATGFTTGLGFNVMEDNVNIRDADIKFNNLIQNINSPRVIALLSYRLIIHDLENTIPFRVPQEINSFFDNDQHKQKILTSFRGKLDSMLILSTTDINERRLLKVLDIYNYDYNSLSKNLSIERLRFTDYISIDYTSENPYLSSFIVNTLVSESIRFNSALIMQTNAESLQYLTELVQQKEQQLEDKTQKLRNFKTSNRFLDVDMERQSKINQITDIENQKEELQSDIREAELSIENLDNRISQLTRPESENNDSNQEKIIELRNRINEVNQRYVLTQNPVLMDSLNLLRGILREELAYIDRSSTTTNNTRNISELRNERDELEIKLKVYREDLISLNNKLNSLNINVSSYASKEAAVSSIQREVNLATQEYLTAQEHLNTARNASIGEGNNLKQVLFGQPAIEPEPSGRLLTILLSAISSFVICVFVFIIIELLDLSIKTPSNFKKTINTNLIGSVILSPKSGKRKNRSAIFYEEEIKKIRYSIETSDYKIFLFTSTRHNTGKSTLIIDIAKSLIQKNRNVLVIDANFKNNTITRLFTSNTNTKPNNEQASIKPFNLYLKSRILKKGDIIGSSLNSNTSVESLDPNSFKEFLNRIENQYDYILIEGPALNHFADSRELLTYADTSILIFSALSGIKQIDLENLEFIQSHNKKYFGAVLNMIKPYNLDI